MTWSCTAVKKPSVSVKKSAFVSVYYYYYYYYYYYSSRVFFLGETHCTVTVAVSRALPEKLTGPQAANKFPAFYGTRRFITVLTRARHLSLSWTRTPQSMATIQILKDLL